MKSEAYLQLGPLQNKQTDNIHFSYRITVPFLIKVYCTGHLLRLVKMKCGVARIYIYIQPKHRCAQTKIIVLTDNRRTRNHTVIEPLFNAIPADTGLVKQRMGAMILSRATRILYIAVCAALRPVPLVQYQNRFDRFQTAPGLQKCRCRRRRARRHNTYTITP